MNPNQITPRQLKTVLEMDMRLGQVPFITSDPGEGKSSLIHYLAHRFNLMVIDLRLSTADVPDLTGYPTVYTDSAGVKWASLVPFDHFPLEGRPLPINKKTGKTYDGWILFLDEFNSASREVQAAAYKLILDRMVGLHHMHEKCITICAGNEDTSRAITVEQGSAMRSRIIRYHMVLDFQEFMEDVAYAQNWDPAMCAYLEWRKMPALKNFDPNADQETFNCPRTLDMVQRRLALLRSMASGKPLKVSPVHEKSIIGTMDQNMAIELVSFINSMADLDLMSKISSNPATAPIPATHEARYFTVTMLAASTDARSVDNSIAYMSRFPEKEFRVIFGRALLSRHPRLRTVQSVEDFMLATKRM